MKLFQFLLGKTPKDDEKQIPPYHELIALITPEYAQEAVKNNVDLAQNNPQAYFAQYQNDLLERSIISANDVTPWIALVDALQNAGVLYECDWKMDGEELVYCLQEMAKPLALEFNPHVLQALEKQDIDTTHSFSKSITQLLAPDYIAVFLDIDSDSYPLMIISKTILKPAQKLAKQCGHKIIILNEKC